MPTISETVVATSIGVYEGTSDSVLVLLSASVRCSPTLEYCRTIFPVMRQTTANDPGKNTVSTYDILYRF